jgi:PTS system glucitol/sorbitol-specific IIA component
MALYYRTVVTAVGPEVADLLDGGVLILFADGAPPELAEVSVLHRVEEGPSTAPPPVGAEIRIGEVTARLTAIGPLAWAKIAEMGHVVINFDGTTTAGRPGEIAASMVDPSLLQGVMDPGAVIVIADAAQ